MFEILLWTSVDHYHFPRHFLRAKNLLSKKSWLSKPNFFINPVADSSSLINQMRKQSLILIYSTSNLLSESNNSILTRGYSLYPLFFFCGKNHTTQAHKNSLRRLQGPPELCNREIPSAQPCPAMQQGRKHALRKGLWPGPEVGNITGTKCLSPK